MKPILQGVAMMEAIAVETAPILSIVLNAHAMMEGHCHITYHVSQGRFLSEMELTLALLTIEIFLPSLCLETKS